jgi:hypothetical protein
MRINNIKKFTNKKSLKGNKGNNKPQKFLYERQQQRQKIRKTEEEFIGQFSDQDHDNEEQENSQNSKNWISQDDSENESENKNKNSKNKKTKNKKTNENSNEENSQSKNESESESHSDSDSEGDLYKENNDDENFSENSENKKKFLNDINITLTEEDKEKINTIYLESIENCKDLKKKIEMTKDFIKAEKNETEFGLSYLDSKNGMMIMYETYLILYSMMKFSGINLGKNLNKKDFDFNNDNNIMKNLITCRTFLEKIKNIDFKLRNQIERFIKLSEDHENNEYNNNKNNNEEENEINSRVFYFKYFILF